MPKGKHRITKERAIKLVAGMKKRISDPGSPFKDFPQGFIFDVDAVRKLLDHPDAEHFIIRFGWKEAGDGPKSGIAPVLCVANSDFQVLPFTEGQVGVSSTGSQSVGTPGEPPPGGESGGYLDEGGAFPPPQLKD